MSVTKEVIKDTRCYEITIRSPKDDLYHVGFAYEKYLEGERLPPSYWKRIDLPVDDELQSFESSDGITFEQVHKYLTELADYNSQ